HHLALDSFPTRRSSDLFIRSRRFGQMMQPGVLHRSSVGLSRKISTPAETNFSMSSNWQAASPTLTSKSAPRFLKAGSISDVRIGDRKSTRLNSSHVEIS